MYDIFVSTTGRDVLLPDGKFYSMYGLYIAHLLSGYDKVSMPADALPPDAESRSIFLDILDKEGGRFPAVRDETDLWLYFVGFVYFIFGYFPLAVKIFNIALSILSIFLIFRITRRHFGDLAANTFLIIGLFLPTQVGYSITLSKDFVRMFVVYLTLWVVYG